MRFDEFKQAAFDCALSSGCEAAELFMIDSESTSVSVLEQKVESHTYSHSSGVSLRVKLDGRDGYYYTESLSDPRDAVNKAMDNARFAEKADHPMNSECAGAYNMPDCDDTAERVSTGDMIDIALDTEKYALGADECIKRIQHNEVAKEQSTTLIANTLGLNAAYTSSVLISCFSPVAEKDGEKQNGYTFASGSAVRSPKNTALRGVQLAMSRFGAVSIPGGDYPIIIQSKAMIRLLETFASQFFADNVQKGLSPLQGKEGQVIASRCINLTDDPFLCALPRPFDDEGSLSRLTPIIRGGRLDSLLHNLKTAKKAGCSTTANARRPSLSSPIGVGCTNLVLEEGSASLEQMMLEMGDGLLINSLSGLHAGAEPVTGDFSLLASGFEVKDGKISRPVEGITVAGTFARLLENIEKVGNDTYYSEPMGSVYASPSVYLKKGIKVSGE